MIVEREELLARVAAARRDGRTNVGSESAVTFSGSGKEQRRAAFRRPLKGRPSSLLHVWKVQCPNNKHLTTLVTSPLAPRFCPVCGIESYSVTEVEPV